MEKLAIFGGFQVPNFQGFLGAPEIHHVSVKEPYIPVYPPTLFPTAKNLSQGRPRRFLAGFWG